MRIIERNGVPKSRKSRFSDASRPLRVFVMIGRGIRNLLSNKGVPSCFIHLQSS